MSFSSIIRIVLCSLIGIASLLVIYVFYGFGGDYKYHRIGDLVELNRGYVTNLDRNDEKRVKGTSLSILGRLPVDDEALSHLVPYMILKEDLAGSYAVIKHVRDRNPRNRGVVKLSLALAKGSNDFPKIYREADLLYRLDANNREEYLSVFVEIYGREEGRQIIDQALSQSPDWGTDFLIKQFMLADELSLGEGEHMTKLGRSLEIYTTSKDDLSIAKNLFAIYLNKLFKFGRFDEAYEIWRRNSGVGASNNLAGLLPDPTFSNDSLLPVFSWYFFNSKEATLEPDRGNGLHIYFKGGKKTRLAQIYFPMNLKMAKAGPRQLDIQAFHKFNSNKGKFSFTIRCIGQSKPFAKIDVDEGVGDHLRKLINIETWPETCSFGVLELWGEPSVFSQSMTMALRHVDINVGEY